MTTQPDPDAERQHTDEVYQEDEESTATEEGMPLPPERDPEDESGAIGN